MSDPGYVRITAADLRNSEPSRLTVRTQSQPMVWRPIGPSITRTRRVRRQRVRLALGASCCVAAFGAGLTAHVWDPWARAADGAAQLSEPSSDGSYGQGAGVGVGSR